MTLSANFSLSNLKVVQPISGWQDFLLDGEAFLKTASGALEKARTVFTPEILYNIIAMAIEKLVMAALMKHGAMPYNHTIKDLVEAMDETFPDILNKMKNDLLRMDSYQEICDLDGFKITPPEMTEIPWMLELAKNFQKIVNTLIKPQ